MEVEWTQSENKRNEYEAEAQQLWDEKEALAKDKEEVSMICLADCSCADRAYSLSSTCPKSATISRSSSTRFLNSRTASTS